MREEPIRLRRNFRTEKLYSSCTLSDVVTLRKTRMSSAVYVGGTGKLRNAHNTLARKLKAEMGTLRADGRRTIKWI